MSIATGVEQLIGNTPLMRLTRLEQKLGLQGQLLAKLEIFQSRRQHQGSRRPANAATRRSRAGRIGPGALIIEPTSGNTGIGLCMLWPRRAATAPSS